MTISTPTSSEEVLNISPPGPSNLRTTLIVLLSILSAVGQGVFLPLFEASFAKGDGGVYYVLFVSALAFNFIYWPLSFYDYFVEKSLTMAMIKHKPYMLFLLGFCDALNGLLVVYAASLSRTPGDLQALLGQVYIPFTLLFSRLFLKKRYSGAQMYGAFVVIVGVLVSLTPLFLSFFDDASTITSLTTSNIIWSCVFVLAFVPGTLMNIIEEEIFKEFKTFNVNYMLAQESLYQFLTVMALFWTDCIPGFGTHANIEEWWQSFMFSFQCTFAPWTLEFVGNCDYSLMYGLLFTMSYVSSYTTSALLVKTTSANTVAIIGSIPPSLVLFFWAAFPSLYAWAGGSPYTWVDILFSFMSLLVVIPGALMFRLFEASSKKDKYLELN
eukprot:TRINITY_DN743_c0_g1_i1.p1 TRINITY_DN743_c0_g1~~TRINITY_DN743_c0_g1_i1.p1  ORF type:complete len:383 (+),score=143.23 TRINITY_DN743_c0_g1_i1:484-1632(+)